MISIAPWRFVKFAPVPRRAHRFFEGNRLRSTRHNGMNPKGLPSSGW
jgi:hypothetical protein